LAANMDKPATHLIVAAIKAGGEVVGVDGSQ
jgi:hypothetical protein